MSLAEVLAPATREASRVRGLGTSVFTEINLLAARHGAVNLGQGTPSFDGPEFIKEAAIAAIREGKNQYCRTSGLLDLAHAVAGHERRFYGLDYDPEDEITVYSGATEGIFAAFQTLVEPGDEVILFEPFYDSYFASAQMAGATIKAVPLTSASARDPQFGYDGQFGYDPRVLEAAVSERTRMIVVNTPHNPTGKVFSRAELEHVAQVCRRHDLVAVTDEVYEHLVYTGEHLPLAAMPGMRERTVTISSTGKTFSLTGWKVGYSCAPPDISAALRTAHQFITFSTATPFQHAMAVALAADDGYFQGSLAHYRARRDRLCDGLAEAGFGIEPPQGTYFVLADIRPLGFDDDLEFCTMLPERYGVAAVPPRSFYIHPEHGMHLARFAFCKDDAVLDEAIRRLRKLKERL